MGNKKAWFSHDLAYRYGSPGTSSFCLISSRKQKKSNSRINHYTGYTQTQFRVATPRVNPGSEPVQPPHLAGVWTVAETQTQHIHTTRRLRRHEELMIHRDQRAAQPRRRGHTDGVGVSSGGRETFDSDSMLVAPWLAHLGVHRPCRRAPSLPSSNMGLAAFSYFGCFSALRLHVSAYRGSFAARFGCERGGVL